MVKVSRGCNDTTHHIVGTASILQAVGLLPVFCWLCIWSSRRNMKPLQLRGSLHDFLVREGNLILVILRNSSLCRSLNIILLKHMFRVYIGAFAHPYSRFVKLCKYLLSKIGADHIRGKQGLSHFLFLAIMVSGKTQKLVFPDHCGHEYNCVQVWKDFIILELGTMEFWET